MRGRFEKSRWLKEDLAQLGVADVSQLPQLCALPSLDTPARVLGTMYVLEGSTLGGRHIASLLNAGAAADLPKRFFSSYGSEVGSRWRSFCAALEELKETSDHDAAAENARATFESMRCWLRKHS
jgi:heme oxygenase